jgi:hypothetical protein
MSMQKEKLAHDSQMLKDRIDIYEQVDKEKGYNKKKAKLQ